LAGIQESWTARPDGIFDHCCRNAASDTKEENNGVKILGFFRTVLGCRLPAGRRVRFANLAAEALWSLDATAWGSANRSGGSTTHSPSETSHQNRWSGGVERVERAGAIYHVSGGSRFRAYLGANGVHYLVVPAP